MDRGTFGQTEAGLVDRRRVLAASDPTGRQAWISLGRAVTNLVTAARYLGFRPALVFSPLNPADVQPIRAVNGGAPRYIPIATARFERDPDPDPRDRGLFEAISRRRVNRRKYDRPVFISEELATRLRQVGAAQPVDLQLLFRQRMADRLRNATLAGLQFQADNQVANDARFVRELGAWFLPNDTPAYVGMPGDTFGLQAGQAARLQRGFAGQIALEAEDLAGLARASKAGIESAALVGLIAVPENRPYYWVQAGMALEQIALRLERDQLQMAVYAGLAEVDWVRRSWESPTGRAGRLVIVFRAGATHEGMSHSPRLPIERILLAEGQP